MALVCYTEEIYLNNIYVNNIIHERSLIGQTYIQTHKTDIGGKCSELPAGATPQTHIHPTKEGQLSKKHTFLANLM